MNNYTYTMHSQNKIENGWGFYVDIESLQSSFPNNEDFLRKKYNVQMYDTYYGIDMEYEYINEDAQDIEQKCMIKPKYVYCLILYSFVMTIIIYSILHCHHNVILLKMNNIHMS